MKTFKHDEICIKRYITVRYLNELRNEVTGRYPEMVEGLPMDGLYVVGTPREYEEYLGLISSRFHPPFRTQFGDYTDYDVLATIHVFYEHGYYNSVYLEFNEGEYDGHGGPDDREDEYEDHFGEIHTRWWI